MKETLLIALGGNSLIKKGQRGSIDEQFENLRPPIQQIARLSKKYDIVITHGNGPQVGNLLLQQEKCPEVPIMPLEILVAQTQGQVGYMIESTLDNELKKWGANTKQLFVTVLTYVVVDIHDPAFKSPSKPIGPFFSKEQAEQLPYPTVETAAGYRRVVASPKPLTIVEKREIKRLLYAEGKASRVSIPTNGTREVFGFSKRIKEANIGRQHPVHSFRSLWIGPIFAYSP